MPDEDDDGIVCATYTHARRHPMVLGNIGGWTPPFQLSLVQVAVVLSAYFVEFRTYEWWGRFLPQTPAILFALGAPWALAWVARHTRIEGRSLPRLAVGYLGLLWTPRHGEVGGRPYRAARAATPLAAALYVEDGEALR
jgi:hypothetical protein